MRKEARLYNVFFPIYFLFFFPQLWLIMLPVNFLVDSLVIYFSGKHQKLDDPRTLWKQHILPVWIFGFICDLVGAVLVIILYLLWSEMGVTSSHFWNPLFFPGTTLIAIPGVILAGVLIYFCNKRLVFRFTDLDPAAIHRICLHLGIFTAPYTMLIPLYG